MSQRRSTNAQRMVNLWQIFLNSLCYFHSDNTFRICWTSTRVSRTLSLFMIAPNRSLWSRVGGGGTNNFTSRSLFTNKNPLEINKNCDKFDCWWLPCPVFLARWSCDDCYRRLCPVYQEEGGKGCVRFLSGPVHTDDDRGRYRRLHHILWMYGGPEGKCVFS